MVCLLRAIGIYQVLEMSDALLTLKFELNSALILVGRMRPHLARKCLNELITDTPDLRPCIGVIKFEYQRVSLVPWLRITVAHDRVWTNLESLSGSIACYPNGSDFSNLPSAITPRIAADGGIGPFLDFLAKQSLWIFQQATAINRRARLALHSQQLLCRESSRTKLAVSIDHLRENGSRATCSTSSTWGKPNPAF